VNQLTGQITAIESNHHVSLVDVTVEGEVFSATLLETPETAPYLRLGQPVTMLFKETEVSLAKNLSGLITLRNRFPVTITEIERGTIMSAVRLAYRGLPLTSVVTTRSLDKLGLVPGDIVEALVKANEVVLKAES